ncbi:MAG: DUF975 family protein [Bacteroidaceae bacterium]|nr:DUF975 family protein [Bacteroidaceae bacterium]
MKRITQLKDEALDALHGNFGRAALSTLGWLAVTYAVSFMFSLIGGVNILQYYSAVLNGDFSSMLDATGGNIFISILEFLAAIFFTAPLGVGVINAFRALLESKGSDNSIFTNFFKIGFSKNYLHIVLVSFVSGLLIGLMVVPVFLILVLVIFLFHSGVATVIFAIAAVVYAIWIGLMYSQISFIIVDNPELDIIDTMRRSRQLMDGNKFKFFVLALSFIGWIILGIFTLCIGYLWLMPYISTTEAAFYCDIRDAEKTAE